MKTAAIGIILSVFSLNVFSQEPSLANKREISISTNNPFAGTYDLNYKSEFKKDKFFTLGLVNFSSSYDKSIPSTSISFPESNLRLSGGFELGLEKRKPLSDNMEIFYGFDLRSSLYFYNDHQDDPNLPIDLRNTNRSTLSSGLGFNFGTIFQIKNNFFFAAELNPSFLYNYSINEIRGADVIIRDRDSGFDFIVSSKTIKFSLIYQWKK